MASSPPPPAAPRRTAPPAGARRWARHAVVAAVGLGALVLSRLLLGDPVERVPGWEADLFSAFNDLTGTAVLRWPLWLVMQLGTVVTGLVIAAALYALTRRARPALATACAVVLGWLAARIVKDAVERGRPADLLEGVHVRDELADGYGYVSGHTTVAFALATALTAVLPGRWRLLPWLVAVLVGVARIYHGVHLPLDVLGGAGLGVLCGVAGVIVVGALAPPEGAPGAGDGGVDRAEAPAPDAPRTSRPTPGS